MSKISPREKRALILGGVFMLIFSVAYWGILPIMDKYSKMEEDLIKAKSQYNQMKSLAWLEEDYADHLEGYDYAYKVMRSWYFTDMNEKQAILKFLPLIEELTISSGVTIISKTTGVNEEDGYKSIKVNLTLKATPEQLTELMVSFRESEIMIKVDRLRIDLDQRNELLQVKLTVSTLVLTEEGEKK